MRESLTVRTKVEQEQPGKTRWQVKGHKAGK